MKSMIKCLVFLLAIFILFSGCSRRDKNRSISISGAFALYPLVIKWAEEYNKLHPDVKFDISGGGAGKGMADALSGVVDLGMFSREISQEEINNGAWWIGLAIDAVVPTVNSDNPYIDIIKERGMTAEKFRGIFIENRYSTWEEALGLSGNTKLIVYTRSDACGAAEIWGKFMGGSQEDIRGVGVFGDPALADAVIKDKYGVGFNNTIFAYNINTGLKREGIEIIPIDINSNGKIDPNENFYNTFAEILNAIAEGVFPYPPARELYFVSNGKPQKKVVKDFIKWCLTEGQQFVGAAGYVPLKQEAIDNYLIKLGK